MDDGLTTSTQIRGQYTEPDRFLITIGHLYFIHSFIDSGLAKVGGEGGGRRISAI